MVIVNFYCYFCVPYFKNNLKSLFDRRRVYVVDFNLPRFLSSLSSALGNDIHASFVFFQHLYAF